MNKERRASLRKALRMIESARDIVESACNEESDCLDNIPENLQGADRYEEMENTISNLEDAVESLDDAISSVSDSI